MATVIRSQAAYRNLSVGEAVKIVRLTREHSTVRDARGAVHVIRTRDLKIS